MSGGSSYDDVRKFFFLWNIVVPGSKIYEKKATQLHFHLNGEQFDFYFEKCAHNEGRKLEASNYLGVKKALVAESEEPSDPEEDICRVANSTIDPANIFTFLRDKDPAFENAMLNSEAKFWPPPERIV